MTSTPIAERRFVADRGDERLRLDQAVMRRLADEPGLSRTRVQRWLGAGLIAVNGVVGRRASSSLRQGDEVVVTLPKARVRKVHAPEPLDVAVLYEDQWLVVVNKPAGMVSHPTGRLQSGTLFNALLHQARAWEDTTSRPGLVHRLDKDTSGVLLVAKSRTVHARAARILSTEHASKTYLAVVLGKPPEEATLTFPLGKIAERPPRVGVVEDGWPSVTWIQRLQSTWPMPEGLALLECTLGTGRLHQIRAHLLAAGWPIAGDRLYRSAKAEAKLPELTRAQVEALEGQALHAWRLTMPHPMTGEELDITAPVPARLQALGVNPGGSWDASAGRPRPGAIPHA
jgi:23S rRNA pseudouridine1911/1915/1917 synthase